MKLLVVVDMQNDFIDGALGSAEAQAIVDRVASKIRQHDGMIAVTHDTHEPEYLTTQEGKHLPVVHCVKDTEGWRLNQKIFDVLNEKFVDGTSVDVFFKPTFGCTEMAELDIPLVDEIELVGLCTDICVISNAMLMKAYHPEIPIAVDASCCAGVTPESHANALRAMRMCQIKINNWEE